MPAFEVVVSGYWLAQHVLNRLMQEKNLGQEEAWKRPLFTDEKNDWMKERKAKAVWRLAVETAITLRDNKKPSDETEYNLYGVIRALHIARNAMTIGIRRVKGHDQRPKRSKNKILSISLRSMTIGNGNPRIRNKRSDSNRNLNRHLNP